MSSDLSYYPKAAAVALIALFSLFNGFFYFINYPATGITFLTILSFIISVGSYFITRKYGSYINLAKSFGFDLSFSGIFNKIIKMVKDTSKDEVTILYFPNFLIMKFKYRGKLYRQPILLDKSNKKIVNKVIKIGRRKVNIRQLKGTRRLSRLELGATS